MVYEESLKKDMAKEEVPWCFRVRETRAARLSNQRLVNQREQIPSAPKLRTSNLDFNFKPS